jgi:hypothetical protein
MTVNDMEPKSKFTDIVDFMIPATEGEERFWDTAAREVLRGVLAYCHEHNQRSNAELWQALNSPAAEIRHMCGTTPLGTIGYAFIEDAESKQAVAVLAHLMSYMSCLEDAAETNIEEE